MPKRLGGDDMRISECFDQKASYEIPSARERMEDIVTVLGNCGVDANILDHGTLTAIDKLIKDRMLNGYSPYEAWTELENAVYHIMSGGRPFSIYALLEYFGVPIPHIQ